jgi:hypothetical protein
VINVESEVQCSNQLSCHSLPQQHTSPKVLICPLMKDDFWTIKHFKRPEPALYYCQTNASHAEWEAELCHVSGPSTEAWLSLHLFYSWNLAPSYLKFHHSRQCWRKDTEQYHYSNQIFRCACQLLNMDFTQCFDRWHNHWPHRTKSGGHILWRG